MNSCKIKFSAYGHKNILGTHRNTLEFTKKSELTPKGDCVVGVSANFSFSLLKPILDWDKIKIDNISDDLVESFSAIVNKDFSDENEIVFRRSEFNSERTLGLRCDKAAIDLDRDLIKKLKNPDCRIEVVLNKL